MKKYLIYGFIGALLGLGFYYFIGCNSQSCPITSSPVKSILLGLVVGLFLAIDLKPIKKESIEDKDDTKLS